MPKFRYAEIFPPRKGKLPYRRIGCDDFIRISKWKKGRIIELNPDALALIAETAFHDMSFYLPKRQLDEFTAIIDDPEASENDRFVAASLIENAIISAEGVLPLCQDTGVANVLAEKGECIFTGSDDACHISRGIYEAYRENNLRYSLVCPKTIFGEANSETNLPAQIDIAAVPGDEYRFFFIAKGGGSSNKTFLFQENKSLLNEKSLEKFLKEKLATLGVAACPPYHIGIAIGGTSPELSLKTAKLAAAGYYDSLPSKPMRSGNAFRVPEWEKKILSIAKNFGFGAQFGGKYFASSARVIRLPRHAASCHVGIAVSCVAHRNLSGIINADGIFLEKLDLNPGRLADKIGKLRFADAPLINLDAPIYEICRQLSKHPAGTRVRLSGPLIVARDIAHTKLNEKLEKTGKVPDYFKNYCIYHAGPAKTPKGMPSGSFGPTTAQRMDPHLEKFMNMGASLVTIAKGNRAASVTESCRRNKGFYLGTIGGAAALVAKKNILESKVIDMADLGMEAVRKLIVKDMPAFIICDDKGNNIYAK
ncbi:MAG: FumA C-terminus/TtdB family hydratase beta subunit [Lentisphaerae bacterium]|nr:FumA C-terminus/TtdB family hydratase beta subunit [Lentisphaerota bacterium]